MASLSVTMLEAEGNILWPQFHTTTTNPSEPVGDFSLQATYPYQGVNFLNQHFPLASYLDSTTLFKVLALL